MLTIWKVVLKPVYNAMQEVSLRAPGIICRYRNQKELPVVWFIVDTEGPVMLKTFILLETGKDLHKACFSQEEMKIIGDSRDPGAHGFYTSFVGTSVFDGGNYVLHLFARADLDKIIAPAPAEKMN